MIKNLLSIIFIIILALETRFFYLIGLPTNLAKYNTSGNKTIIVVVCILGFFLAFTKRLSVGIIKKSFFGKIVLILYILIIIEILMSIVNYHQSLRDIVALTSPYFIVLLYFILLIYMNFGGSIKFVKRSIVYFSLILSIVFVVQAIYYNTGHNLFLKTWEIDMTGVGSRLSGIRLTKASPFISLGYLLSLAELINKNNKNKFYKACCLLSILVGGYYIINVCQTRMLIIVLLICSICMVVYNFRKSKFIITLGIVLSVMILITVSKSNIYQQYFESNTDSQYQQSYSRREDAIGYYTKLGFRNVVLGSGLVVPIYGEDSYSIVRGSSGDYYLEDVGIFGFFSSFGILGLVWYIYLLIKIFNILFKLNKLKKLDNAIENVGFFTFILLTSATLFILNTAFITVFPILLFFFDHSMDNSKVVLR